MFSNNIRQNKQFGWIGSDDKDSSQQSQKIHDQIPMPPHTNSLTYNDKVEIINENDRNPVSEKQCQNTKFFLFGFVQLSAVLLKMRSVLI